MVRLAWLLVWVSGCAGRASAPPAAPAATEFLCLLLADLSVHPCDQAAVAGLHVRGRLLDGRFSPESDVLGDGPLGEAGAPGWVELGERRFVGAQTGRPPFPPYLEGMIDAEGIFRPTSRALRR